MRRLNEKLATATQKSVDSIKNDGLAGFTKRSAKYAYYKKFPEKRKQNFKDILFINGCALPHPARYRVNHQIEQLRSNGLSADIVFYENLNMDRLKLYRGFVFFRCPVTDTVREFIKQAKRFNKACFFDVDDLVIDTKYTDEINYVANMSAVDKKLYDDGVVRMGETMKLCDHAITTTNRLQQELKKYTKDVFINRNVASDEMVGKSLKSLEGLEKPKNRVVIGYFSGSITHNENFDMILPSIVKLLEKHKNLYLKVVGILDIPKELAPYKNRLIRIDFMDWRTMPKEIALCDINIAPLTQTIFNEAKSENKWTEAALVKVVTAASNIGAFKEVIKHEQTGILVDDDKWFEALDDLIANKDKREKIANAAHEQVLAKHTAISTGYQLANYIRNNLARNIGFVLPSTDISGGVNVVIKHANILRDNGWDVTLIDAVDKKTLRKSNKQYDYRFTVPGNNVLTNYKTNIEGYFDTMVATLWSTLKPVKGYSNVSNRLYFVQSFETDFYPWGLGDPRMEANATYCDTTNVRYITMSLWCQKWLKEKFNKDSKYAPNGIDLHNYPFHERELKDKKIHILIEGDSQNKYKNTDEAFRIVEKLDPDKFEVSYLSYRREPKKWYRVDHFYNRIAPEKVGEVYAKCDILIKTSLLESFSYPPLEMMATGGLSVVVPNDGNREYLRDGVNCLFYKQGDIDDGVSKVQSLIKDKALRKKLIENGKQTADNYQWHKIEKSILALYE